MRKTDFSETCQSTEIERKFSPFLESINMSNAEQQVNSAITAEKALSKNGTLNLSPVLVR